MIKSQEIRSLFLIKIGLYLPNHPDFVIPKHQSKHDGQSFHRTRAIVLENGVNSVKQEQFMQSLIFTPPGTSQTQKLL